METELGMRPGPFVVISPDPERFCRFWCHLFDWVSEELSENNFLLKSESARIYVRQGKAQKFGDHIFHLETGEGLDGIDQDFFIQKYKFALYRSGLGELPQPTWDEQLPAGLVFKDPDKRTWKILGSYIS